MTEFRPIVMEQGQEKVIVYQVTQDGVAQDCEGFTFRLGVKEKIDDAAYKIGPVDGVVSADGDGIMSLVTFIIPTATTKAMTPFGGIYSAAMYDGSGEKVPLTQPGGVSYILKKAILTVA